MRRLGLLFSFLFFCLAQAVVAQEDDVPVEPAAANADAAATDEAAETSSVKGEGSVGLILNSGNTNNESFNGKITIDYDVAAWQHDFALTSKRVKEDRIVTAERNLFTEKSAYSFSERSYGFASVRYDDDRFDGFEYQASLSLGIGWALVNTETQQFDLELGAGRRRNEVSETGEIIEEGISRFSERFSWQLSPTTSLTQDLLVEAGDSNTTTEFNLGLKVNINKVLALHTGLNIKHNSEPPEGNEKTDRTTSITLVFGF